MNNYPYLIKAKAKANEAKSLFCWFSAKSDSRAERKILDILEDAEINVGRGASHQLPIRTNWLIVDDLPEEGVLDDTWCDRYELGEDGLTWQKIIKPDPSAPTEKETLPVTSDEANAPMPEQTEVKNKANGRISFGTVTYGKDDLGDETEKTFTYKVKESGNRPGVANDTETKTVKVTVKVVVPAFLGTR